MTVRPSGCQAGRRQDAYTAYLLPIMPREGLDVRSGAQVVKIEMEEGSDGKKRVTALVYMLHGLARVTVYARREIILSAGWMGSPKVLLLSGIGPRAHLEDLEIDVEHELEGVGQQLRGRPHFGMPFAGQIIPPEGMPHVFTSRETEAAWARNGSGVLDVDVESVYGQGSSMLQGGEVDFLMGFSDKTDPGLLPLQAVVSACQVCRPFSQGKVELLSPSPTDDVNVDFGLLEDERDVDVLVACARRQLDVLRHYRYRGMDLVGLHKMSDRQLRHYIRTTASFSQDATSTCRMGDGPRDVVDSRLRVHGFMNLRVIDGSVMPEMPCSGPMATTYMVGERGAAMVMEDAVKALAVGSHVIDSQHPARAVAVSAVASVMSLVAVLLVAALLRCRAVRGLLRAGAAAQRPGAEALSGSRSALVVQQPSKAEATEVKEAREQQASAPKDQGQEAGPDTGREAETAPQLVRNRSQNQSVAEPGEAERASKLRKMPSLALSIRSVTARFNRSFRRTSLLDAMSNRELASGPHLSIYFANLSCHAQSVTCGGLKTRNSTRILSSVSGKIENGKLSVVMGSSGSGKTTLLNLLAQRSVPMKAEGELMYKVQGESGELVGASGASRSVRHFMRRNIAFLGQEAEDLLPELTVFETMVFYFTLMVSPQLTSPYSGMRVINDTLEFIGLAEQAHKYVWQMSGGQKRRLQIGIRLLDTPLALFLDEPDAGLDSTTLLKIMILLTQIAEKYGVTIVATLHRPRQEVLRLAHSICVMYQGAGMFQGRYSDLEGCLHRLQRHDYVPGSCAMDYVLDYEGFDAGLLKALYADHARCCNSEVLPTLRDLAAAQDPDSAELAGRLRQGSVLLCSTTLFSVFVNLVGQPRSWRAAASDVTAKHACAATLVATAGMFLVFTDGFLPIRSTEDVAVLHGAFLIWASSTLTVFQVVVAGGMVEPELRAFQRLMYEQLLSPLHVTLFWVARSFVLCVACLAGFAVFYVGLGFQAAHAFDSGLVWFLFVLQTCLAAHLFQVAFGKDWAPVLYGLWSAVQIMFCGLTVPLTRIPAPWVWIYRWNPQYYVFSLQISMEMAVGRPVECGEYCAALLEAFGYREVENVVLHHAPPPDGAGPCRVPRSGGGPGLPRTSLARVAG